MTAKGLVMTASKKLVLVACAAMVMFSGGLPAMAQNAPAIPLDDDPMGQLIKEIQCRSEAEDFVLATDEERKAQGLPVGPYALPDDYGTEYRVSRDEFIEELATACFFGEEFFIVVPLEFLEDVEQS